MFKGDDDDEPDNSVGAVRYPCMPSLVALQQMRNRLNLAHLGKKLMKWTAVATGKELRRLVFEIMVTYRTFSEDMRNAFILLARCRYFYPNLNKMVLENVAKEAAVTVSTRIKSMSGVKVTHLDIIDLGVDCYEHLGIDKGGQVIFETKEAWRNLLKRIVLMLDQKISFEQVELAHKSATKRQNVLGRVVIPRTEATISYIKDELEERAREEFYRLKKMLELKRKRQKKCEHIQQVITCPVCLKLKARKEVIIEKCFICGAVLHPKDVLPEKSSEDKALEDSRLEEFKAHITEIVDFTREIEEKGTITASVQDFLKTAEELRGKLDRKAEELEEFERIPSDVPLQQLCHICLKRFEDEQAAKGKPEEILVKEESKQEMPFIESARTVQSAKHPTTTSELCELHSQVETDLELGTFETEIKEITKIIRVKNEDGTVTEERKTIKIKKEIKAPNRPRTPAQVSPGNAQAANSNVEPGRIMYQASDVSAKSNPYPSNKTIQTIIIKVPNIMNMRLIKSDVAIKSSPMSAPAIRSCLSSISLFSLSTYAEVCDYSSHENLSKIRLPNFIASSTETECTLKLIEASNSINKSPKISNTINMSKIIINLTNSESALLDNLSENVRISKSTNDIPKQAINYRIRKSVSYVNSFKTNDL